MNLALNIFQKLILTACTNMLFVSWQYKLQPTELLNKPQINYLILWLWITQKVMIYYLELQATTLIPRNAGVQIALASVDTRSSVELNLR